MYIYQSAKNLIRIIIIAFYIRRKMKTLRQISAKTHQNDIKIVTQMHALNTDFYCICFNALLIPMKHFIRNMAIIAKPEANRKYTQLLLLFFSDIATVLFFVHVVGGALH